MRVLLIVTLYNALNVILAQFDIINEDIGDFHFHGEVGRLPLKYTPLSAQDQKASDKAADVIDFIALVPKIDPLNLPVVQPLGIDIPFLWLSGKVYLANFVLAGVKQLELHGLELRLINLRSDLNITIPQLYVEGDFHLQASLSFLPIIFRCHISANLFDVDVKVSSGGSKQQAPPVGEVLQIDSVAVTVDVRDVVFNLTNMVMGEEIEESNDELYNPVIQLFNTQTKSSSSISDGNMLNGILETALDIVNKELLKIPIEVFEEYLLSDTY